MGLSYLPKNIQYFVITLLYLVTKTPPGGIAKLCNRLILGENITREGETKIRDGAFWISLIYQKNYSNSSLEKSNN